MNCKINLFKSYITGKFDNSEQVNTERSESEQIHPYAKHVNNVFDERIEGLTKKDNCFFLLEESDYVFPDGTTQLKPHIFSFEEDKEGNVTLYSYQNPMNYAKDEMRFDNEDFKINYKDLELSQRFKPMTYRYDENKGFCGKSVNKIKEDTKFTLIEEINKDTLIVMELVEVNSKRITTYSTPIVYKRI